MRWHTKPIMQLVVMLVVMTAIVGVQQTAASYLSLGRASTTTASLPAKEGGLVDVQAGAPDPTCPNDAPVQFALTENRENMAPPRRMRYADAPWEYDSLKTSYFTRHDSEADFQQTDFGLKSENLLLRQNDPLDDTQNVSDLMSSMFQYKLTRFKNAYVLKYTPAVVRDDPSPHKGDAPAIEVPSKPGWPICMPTTGYDVGGGYEAMVVSVEGDRITLHIGIHEYMDGNDESLGGCPLGNNNCKGGYWIYISGINVSSDIAAAYNEKKGEQQKTDLQREISHRIELPIVAPGKKLGTSVGNNVIVAVRDSGPLIYANKIFMWGGNYPLRDDLLPANATPTVGPTTPPLTPQPTVPTTPPSTPRPTAPPGITHTPIPTGQPQTQTLDIPIRVGSGISIDCPGKMRIRITGLSGGTFLAASSMLRIDSSTQTTMRLENIPYGTYEGFQVEYVNDSSNVVYAQMLAEYSQLVVDGTPLIFTNDIPTINQDLGRCNPALTVPSGGSNTSYQLTVSRFCSHPVCQNLRQFINDVQSNNQLTVALRWNPNNSSLIDYASNRVSNITNTNLSLHFNLSGRPERFPGWQNAESIILILFNGSNILQTLIFK